MALGLPLLPTGFESLTDCSHEHAASMSNADGSLAIRIHGARGRLQRFFSFNVSNHSQSRRQVGIDQPGAPVVDLEQGVNVLLAEIRGGIHA